MHLPPGTELIIALTGVRDNPGQTVFEDFGRHHDVVSGHPDVDKGDLAQSLETLTDRILVLDLRGVEEDVGDKVVDDVLTTVAAAANAYLLAVTEVGYEERRR